MSEELFFTGYCRQIDGSRTVCAQVEKGKLESVDCGYAGCCHAEHCPIGQKIRKLAET